MRYTTFISDGDSSAFNGVVEHDPYPGHTIEKAECVNHVAKRLGTRLRKLKKDSFVEKRTATGKMRKMSTLGGKNKLTDEVIDKLTGYYGIAIRSSKGTTIEQMKKACLSGFLHVSSTDSKHNHQYCPDGPTSHCFYKKALANNEEPPSHDTMKIKCRLSEDEKQLVMNVYEDLSNDDLLRKCLSGRTQNPNESIHGKVWSKLHKTKHYGRKIVEHVAAQTVIEHNLGYQNACVAGDLGFAMESGSTSNSQFRDKDRLRHSLTPTVKKKKKYVRPTGDDDADYGAGQH
jgi:hypothetical protein